MFLLNHFYTPNNYLQLLYMVLKSVKKNNVRYRFAELDENDKPILTATHEEGLDWKGKGGKIMRINDRKIFNSLAAFLRETGINRKRAKKYEEDHKN